MAHHSLMGRGHSRSGDRARARVRCHSPSPAHEDHERRMADHRTLSSGPRLVALCRHGAANAYEHVYGHACCTRRASILESVFVSTTHCAAGCVIGDVIGAPLVFWAGWTLFGERLYAEYLVLFILAY